MIRLESFEEDTLFPLSSLREPPSGDSNVSKPWQERDGVVLTPDYLVDLMVNEAAACHAVAHSQDLQRTITWLDPACGDGAFVLGILRYYKRTFGNEFFRDMRLSIVAIDISEEALDKASSRIAQYVADQFDADFDEVVDLQLVCTDSLKLLSRRGAAIYQGEVDIVVGNPPYIRHSRLTHAQKVDLRRYFPNLYGRAADFFTYFFGAALDALKPGGILSFVTPATYTRNSIGANLRAHLYEHSSLVAFFDLDENKVFENAAVHTAISVLMKDRDRPLVRYLHFSDVQAIIDASATGYTPERRQLRLNSNGTWNIAPESQTNFSNTRNMVRLEDLGVKVRSGIRSGASRIFIIDDQVIDQFSQDVREHWIKPIVVTDDIQCDRTIASKWLLWIPNSTRSPHPEILAYLEPHRSRLEARAEVKNGSTPWFGLRPCNYARLVETRGIVTPHII